MEEDLKTAFQLSELRYRRLFEAARDGILILNAETGQIEDANPFMVELLGYSHPELLGKELWEIGLFSDIENSRAAFRELQERGQLRYEDLPLQDKWGVQRQVEFVSNLYAENGRHVIQCNIRDITERKQLERRLELRADEGAEASRAKSEFLAILSHELRNPLAPIRYALPQIEQALQDEGARAALAVVTRQVNELVRLVDDLLDITRITSGKVALTREVVTLDAIVSAAVESASPLIHAGRHSFAITATPPEEPIWIEVDQHRVSQVIVNLLTNAAKYTPRGGTITLEADREDDHAVIRVRDNGIGIPPAELPRLFELFWQVKAPTAAGSHCGLGVGLALAKRLVEMHGGTIEAHSAGAGQGAEFVVRLPLAVVTPKEGEQQQPLPAAARKRLKVLVVDDNVDLVEMLGASITQMGHEVRKALDGRSAISAALSFRPDAVLLDLGLPVVNGLDVARDLRRRPEMANVRLVALTGWGQDEDRERTSAAGFDYHLTKPTEPETLERLLTHLAAA
jgi:PAS domain S-box-containing protein